jgi:hypothetical protein
MTEFWATLVGAAVGVVAGALIQYIAQHFVDRNAQVRQRHALKMEMQYNLQVVSDLSDECARFRNAVNGDTLKIYFGYLGYEKALWSQTNALLNSGLLYHWFPVGVLKKLQKISTVLNVNNANWVNNSITQRRETAKAETGFNKTDVVQFVNFIENQINETRTLLSEFIALI